MAQASNDAASSPGEGRIRLQRLMADAGVASRRDCEAMIEKGLVEVNGQTVTRLPVFVDPRSDRVVVDGAPLRFHRPRGGEGDSRRTRAAAAAGDRGPRRTYIMLNKPDRVLCTTRDDAPPEAARTTVLDLVSRAEQKRIYPVGRLDYHSTGLVLLTDDGVLADRLTHARYGVTRTYRVTIKGEIRPDILEDLARRVGVRDTSEPAERQAGGAAHPSVRVARSPGAESANSVLEVTLREGRNRLLRSVLEQMGCVVRKLTRVGLGPLRLSGVAVGEWRDLTADEVRLLMLAGGMTPPGPARGPRGGGSGDRARRRASESKS